MLRESARQEFEEARFEQDPEMINRLIVVGRDAVSQVTDKVDMVYRMARTREEMYNFEMYSFGSRELSRRII